MKIKELTVEQLNKVREYLLIERMTAVNVDDW